MVEAIAPTPEEAAILARYRRVERELAEAVDAERKANAEIPLAIRELDTRLSLARDKRRQLWQQHIDLAPEAERIARTYGG